jgi:hypothetical protein
MPVGGEEPHVSAKVGEFVAIALLAFRGADHAGLMAHIELFLYSVLKAQEYLGVVIEDPVDVLGRQA